MVDDARAARQGLQGKAWWMMQGLQGKAWLVDDTRVG
jgi:hypothetical protein